MLLEQGADLTGHDLDDVGILKAYGLAGAFPMAVADIREGRPLEEALQGQDVCIHLAAISGVEQSRARPYETYDVNVMGTVHVLEVAKALVPDAVVVVASSNHIYGRQTTYPVLESAPLNQRDTYSVSKIAADYIARSYAHNYGLSTVVVRNTNCFGPHDPHHDHLVPGTILSLLKGESPVIRGTGKTKKSYLYVDDVAEAYMAVAQWCAETRHKGEAFNVADEPISVLAMVRAITDIIHPAVLTKGAGFPMFRGSVEGTIILGEPNDQNDEMLDSGLIKRLVGWEPRTSLREGLSRTVEAFQGALVT
tara:strand:+ start:224 stop:1147 length:924 start_codon:yes stop_codon:yes gene_type:complete